MKKLVFTIVAIIIFATNIQAEEYEVLTKDGKKYTGELVERTDSSITLYNRYTLQKTCFLSSEIIEATSAQGSRFTVEGGKIIGLSYEDRLISLDQKLEPQQIITIIFKFFKFFSVITKPSIL